MSGGNRADHEEEQLAAEMREAFESGAFSLDAGEPTRILAGAGSSARIGKLTKDDRCLTGTRLGDFEVLEELGRGGMGVVYRARQTSLDREIALKVLSPYTMRGRMAARRFRIEARAAARLHHTNIVPVYAQGEAGGRLFYAMELIEGGSLGAAIALRSRILSPSNTLLSEQPVADSESRAGDGTVPNKEGTAPDKESTTPQEKGSAPDKKGASAPLTESDVRALGRVRSDYRHLARLIAGVADGLDLAHRCGVTHRDIKPQNLLVGKDRRLQITDFGLARLVDEPGLTLSGEIMGTPAYLSPEQIQPESGLIDYRTDIYSLGVTLYELLTLHRPFAGRTREQTLAAIRHTAPPPPHDADPQLPHELETICLKAMEKVADDRYQTAAEMSEDLRRFADGRPILSKPPGPLVKAGKWIRRHKALTTAIVSVATVVLLAASLTAYVGSTRRKQANQLLDDAFNRIVYLNYSLHEETEPAVAQAEKLGGDRRRVEMLRVLADMNKSEWAGAAETLGALASEHPDDAEIAYLLAWALERNADQQAADRWIILADGLEPKSPAAWFFRGMALHYDRPKAAIESYQQARRIRGRDGELFLQATLHLARAYNQQMYATRRIEYFSEAQQALEQLIEYEVYDAFPHYLLSVAHRLAAEIYTGSHGTRDDSPVQDNYRWSLEAARRGREVAKPDNARPLAAEAMCLESMGQFELAHRARSRQILEGSRQFTRCEGHHYRWRLNFWAGRLDEAMSDIERHRECPIDLQILYDHFFSAIVHAEQGQMDGAIDEVMLIASDTDSALSVIWAATGLRMLGLPADADALLAKRAEAVDFSADLIPLQTAEWVEALYDLASGELSLEEALAQSENVEQPWRLRAEAYFHDAMAKLAVGDREGAVEGFERAFRSHDSEVRYTFCGRLFLVKMEKEPAWPAWIPDLGS